MTLKPMVEPRLTLMSVAKPWIDVLPEPLMAHSLLGLPVLVFSQAISLTTGASQGAAATGGGGRATSRPTAKASVTKATTIRRDHGTAPDTLECITTTLPPRRATANGCGVSACPQNSQASSAFGGSGQRVARANGS